MLGVRAPLGLPLFFKASGVDFLSSEDIPIRWNMSRLQKKKPFSEKTKRKNESDKGGTDAVAATSGVKPSSPGIVSKAKVEKAATEAGTGNLFTRGVEFFREVKVELKKVTWPTRKQTTGTTIVVILFVFVVAAFLGLFDYSLSRLVQVVLT